MVTSSATPALPAFLGSHDDARFRRYADLLNFYNGQQWTGQRRPRERRLTFNYARAVIQKAVAYTMTGRDYAVDPPTPDDEGRAQAQAVDADLRYVWEDNALDLLDYDTETDTAVLGDGAYKVTWDPTDERVVITSPDVQGLHAWYPAGSLMRPVRVAQRWQASTAEASAALALTLPGSPSAPVTVTEDWTAATLDLYVGAQLVERRPNPYGFIPYVLFPNVREPKTPWGVSDLAQMIEPQRELNRAMSQLSAILELSGNPIAVLENITDSTDIAVAPGAVWEVPEKARAYLLDLLQGGGVKLHIDYIDLIYRCLHDLGETPRTAFGENRQALSGVALNTELDPLLKKVTRKRIIRSVAYRQRNELILRLLQQFTGARYATTRTRIVWGAVLPSDRSRQATDERTLVEIGLSSRIESMDRLGIEDPAAVFAQWLVEEEQLRRAGADRVNTNVLSVIGGV